MDSGRMLRTAAMLVVLAGASAPSMAASGRNSVWSLGDIVASNPLAPGQNAAIVASLRAGEAELGVLVMSYNKLHHHAAQDHVLYVVRGRGTARLENEAGEVETRSVAPGDILGLPRGKKHGFEKEGAEDLVFLVVSTPLPPGAEETTFHE